MCFPAGKGTYITRNVCFPGRGTHSLGKCVSLVVEHISLGICIEWFPFSIVDGMTVKTENHIHCTIRIFHDQVHYKFLVVPFASCSVLNAIQGLKGIWEGGGGGEEVTSHPKKIETHYNLWW